MMRLFVSAGIFVAAFSLPIASGDDTFFSRTVEGSRGNMVFKDYSVTVTDEALKKTPSWERSADYPPLSARTAMKVAVELRNKLVKDSKEFSWQVESLALRQNVLPGGLEKWYWVVHFEQRFQSLGSSGTSPDLYVVVLMDGTVIKPVALKKASSETK